MFKCEVIGNLGGDAEIREANGNKFIAFRLAHSEKFEKADGSKIDRTQWIDVTMQNIETKVFPFLKTGVKVFVRGNATLRVYSSPKERAMVAGIKINAAEVELCGGSSEDVPRELIDPDTAQIISVTKLYWSQDCPKNKKSDWKKKLVDKKGNPFSMNFHGFITKEETSEQQAES